jgi:hypothetical protein
MNIFSLYNATTWNKKQLIGDELLDDISNKLNKFNHLVTPWQYITIIQKDDHKNLPIPSDVIKINIDFNNEELLKLKKNENIKLENVLWESMIDYLVKNANKYHLDKLSNIYFQDKLIEIICTNTLISSTSNSDNLSLVVKYNSDNVLLKSSNKDTPKDGTTGDKKVKYYDILYIITMSFLLVCVGIIICKLLFSNNNFYSANYSSSGYKIFVFVILVLSSIIY